MCMTGFYYQSVPVKNKENVFFTDDRSYQQYTASKHLAQYLGKEKEFEQNFLTIASWSNENNAVMVSIDSCPFSFFWSVREITKKDCNPFDKTFPVEVSDRANFVGGIIFHPGYDKENKPNLFDGHWSIHT